MAPKKRKSFEQELENTNIPMFSFLSSKEKITFFKYLAAMTEAGIPFEKALLAIHNQTRSRLMHRVLHLMLVDVASGEFLSTSLKKMPHLFDELEISLVEVGETSGTLTDTLLRLSENLEKSQELRNKVRGALLYPAIVLFATLAITGYLLFFLLPQITPLFVSLNVELPWATRTIVFLSEFALGNVWAIAATALVSVIAFILLLRVRSFRFFIHSFTIQMPIVGPLVRQVQITRFARVVGTMLKAGITVVESFRIGSSTVSILPYRDILSSASKDIQEGGSAAASLAKHRHLFPPIVTQMVSVGEETGKLDESFLFIANFSEREVDDRVKTLTTVLEPLLMIVIGGMVGFIAIAIISPIYELTKGFGR